MVSPTIPPPPLPPRPPQRSIAGPVVLILLGVLFLMGTMGMFEIHHLALLFAHYWPALLILWGIIKLIEHEQAKRYGQTSRGIGVGGVFLMLFLIAAGLIATQVSRLNWRGIGEHIQFGDDNDFNDIFGGSSFDYSGELSDTLPAGATSMRINDDRGTVTVNVSDDKNVRVEWRKKIHAENQKDADGYNAKSDPAIVLADKVIVLNANTQGAGDKGVNTDMDIYVPANISVSITSNRGDVTMAGRNGSVDVNHHRGEVNVSDQTGTVSLSLEGSSARLEHIKGDVTIQGNANEVDIEDVDGAVHLNGEFHETTRLVRVSKTVSFHSSRTDMEFSRLDGRLDLDSGDLRADSLAGPMRLTTRSKDIALDGLSGDLRLEDSNGSVTVGLHKPGSIQIDNRKGDVQVTIPPNTAVKVEARAHEGEIDTDFEEIKVDNHEHQSSASGSIGENGPRVALNAEKGSIEIRKGTVETVAPAPPVPPAPAPSPGKRLKALPAPKAAPVESEN
jgi:DUF4097 and DUF4098 domain-containing protein YvlB